LFALRVGHAHPAALFGGVPALGRVAPGAHPRPRKRSDDQLWHDDDMAEHEPGGLRKFKPLAVVIPAHIAVTAFTWRDLRGRSPEEVRGSKRLWQVASGANTLGSLLYFTLGRKRAGHRQAGR
jgi:hypothetical protein